MKEFLNNPYEEEFAYSDDEINNIIEDPWEVVATPIPFGQILTFARIRHDSDHDDDDDDDEVMDDGIDIDLNPYFDNPVEDSDADDEDFNPEHQDSEDLQGSDNTNSADSSNDMDSLDLCSDDAEGLDDEGGDGAEGQRSAAPAYPNLSPVLPRENWPL